MAELARRFQKRFGFRVFKLEAGVLAPDLEVESLAAIHAAVGVTEPLRMDPDGRWSIPTAVAMGEKLRTLPLECYEDPVRGQPAMAEVRRRTGLVMSTDSCVTRFWHIPEAIETQPIDVILGDHHFWGGVAAMTALGRVCGALGWGLGQHSDSHTGVTMAAMAHVAAIVPQLSLASDTHYPWLADGHDVISGGKLDIVDGAVAVPRGIGLGVELDRDRVSRAHELWLRSGMRRRDDAATMQRFVPGWEPTVF